MRITQVVYRGERLTGPNGEAIGVRVTANDRLLIPFADRGGFEWGYGGAGPVQLAHALVLDATGEEELATRWAHWFMWATVFQWGETWEISGTEVRKWISRFQRPADEVRAMYTVEGGVR